MEKHGDIIMRMQNVLSLPLDSAFPEMEKLVHESSPQELLPCLDVIMEAVFGPYARWDLRSLSRAADPRMFDALHQFLHPGGLVFKVIYKLVTYWDSKTIYNISEYLTWARDLFNDGMPEYFMDKVSVDNSTRRITHMSLNAFELYLLHFAYHLVNPWGDKAHHERGLHAESLYLQLCIDYLTTFLPTDGSPVLPYVAVSYSSLRSSLPRHNQASYRPDLKTGIFRQSLFEDTADTPPQQQPYEHNTVVWRSEAVIYIFVYVWLNYGARDTATYAIRREPPPSMDHVRVVRSLVKHFHYFANSALGDKTPMDTLKRLVRPLFADKVYRFLRCSVHNWPLDMSFRLVLEAWLSYIQPWRYTTYADAMACPVQAQGEAERARDRPVDRIWQNFIAENLLAYTILYRSILPRLARLDLSSVKNALMLFRVAKVFSQHQLNVMIAEVECSLQRRRQGLTVVGAAVPGVDPSPLASAVEKSPYVATEGARWSSSLVHRLQVLEGAQYEYVPVFVGCDMAEVYSLLDMVTAAYISSHVFLLSAQQRSGKDGLVSALKGLFMSASPAGVELYGASLQDRQRVVALLESTLVFVAAIYGVPTPALPDVSVLQAPVVASGDILCQASVSKVSPQLWQVRLPRRPRRPHPRYEGDPDLAPITSTEVAFLVRGLYRLATAINRQYLPAMNQLYWQPGFTGALTRQLLRPPCRIRSYDKNDALSPAASPSPSPLVQRSLPPRLSLRRLAAHDVLAAAAVAVAASLAAGLHPFTLLLAALAVWAACVALRAACEPWLGAAVAEDDSFMDTSDVVNVSY